MERFFAGVGAIVITTRTLFWLCSLSYIVFSVLSAYSLFFTEKQEFPSTEQSCNETIKTQTNTTYWVLATNIIGFMGGACFYHCEKGECCSVFGSILYLLNLINMIALFICAQIFVFGEAFKHCDSLVKHEFKYAVQA